MMSHQHQQRGMTRHRSTSDYNHRDFTDEEREFGKAIERYKREQHRPHPTCAEILEVAIKLGYRKVIESG